MRKNTNACAASATCGGAHRKKLKAVNFFLVTLFLFGSACRNQAAIAPVLDCGEAGSDAATETIDSSIISNDITEDNVDANTLDECAKACANLRKSTIHCLTGFSVDGGESCSISCRHAKLNHLIPIDILCAQKASTFQEAHMCKGWGC